MKQFAPVQQSQSFVPQQRQNFHATGVSQPADVEEIKEESLTRLKATHSVPQQYKVKDGEFANYPEITENTIKKLKARGITSLFPIQMNCFYPIYNREDMIARDLTGSGKTLGFSLPIVEYLRKNQLLGKRKLQAIVLAPTRELAL